jgi:hypothetical protein
METFSAMTRAPTELHQALATWPTGQTQSFPSTRFVVREAAYTMTATPE